MVTLLAKLRADEKDGGEAEPSKESGTLTQAKGHRARCSNQGSNSGGVGTI